MKPLFTIHEGEFLVGDYIRDGRRDFCDWLENWKVLEKLSR
jgi:hypothetical protein